MLALVLQFHDGDRETAMRLARLIADAELEPRADVFFIFAARFDTSHDEATVEHVRKKFPYTETFTSTTKLTGWPAGCNGLWRDVMLMIDKRCEEFDGVLTIEPDVCPVSLHWLNVIINDWQDAKAKGMVQMGAWRNSGLPGGHLNGNSVYRADLASWLRSRGFEVKQIGNGIAYDCAIAPWTREYWATYGRILNRFQTQNITPDEIKTPDVGDEPPVLIHGIKSDDVYNYACAKFKL